MKPDELPGQGHVTLETLKEVSRENRRRQRLQKATAWLFREYEGRPRGTQKAKKKKNGLRKLAQESRSFPASHRNRQLITTYSAGIEGRGSR